MATATPQPLDVFQAMRQLRATRRLKPDAVPEPLIREVVEYATLAPSQSNSQMWKFLAGLLRPQVGGRGQGLGWWGDREPGRAAQPCCL